MSATHNLSGATAMKALFTRSGAQWRFHLGGWCAFCGPAGSLEAPLLSSTSPPASWSSGCPSILVQRVSSGSRRSLGSSHESCGSARLGSHRLSSSEKELGLSSRSSRFSGDTQSMRHMSGTERLALSASMSRKQLNVSHPPRREEGGRTFQEIPLLL